MIYFMQAVDGGPVKIGTTIDLPTRQRALENYYGCRLEVRATMEGGPKEERGIHKRFSHLRLGKTEQFLPDAELAAFIGAPLLVSAHTEAVEAMRGRPVVAVTIKGTPEWKQWLEHGAEHCRLSVSAVVDLALAKYLKSQGFDEKPPER